MHNFPEAVSVDKVKSVFKINEIYSHSSIPLNELYKDISEDEDPAERSSVFTEFTFS